MVDDENEDACVTLLPKLQSASMRWLLSAAIIVAPLSFAQIASAETLQDTLISVYNKNPRLQAERARLRETDETYIQARAQGRLSATASGSYARTEVRTPETPGSFFAPPGGGWRGSDPLAGQVQVIQPLYQGGRVKALKRQAKSGILAARESLRATENSIFVSAAEAYVDVLRDEQAANIRRNNVRVLTSQLTAANARFDVGEGITHGHCAITIPPRSIGSWTGASRGATADQPCDL
ncbi:TolC family protein [Litorimonas sp. RW-G-Af-16]|uniref:TolC family protein n=1 Tax=Litorimonas sp. RW-G-Af-16 TaxID=3241168 RepID=UPI003AADEC9F